MNTLRATTIVALAALLAVPGLALGQTEAYYSQEGVQYYWAHGTGDSGHLVNRGDDSGALPMAFTGCALAQLRPETGLGRIQVAGLIDGLTYIEADIAEFVTPDQTTPGIVTNLTLDSRFGQEPTLRSTAAAWGVAQMNVDYELLLDPVGDGELFDAEFFVSRDGVRDDATGDLLTKADRDDGEFHLRLQTPTGALPQTVEFTIAPPGDLPDGSFSPNEAYSDRFDFFNSKLGGTATVHIETSANSLQDMNELTFSFATPTGRALENVTLAPSLLSPASQDLQFPLSEFGDYTLEVRGKVALASYSVDFTLAPPATMDLDFWWENVTFGQDARSDWGDCRKTLGFDTVPNSIVNRDQPPSFLLEAVLLGLLVMTTAILLIIKVVSESATASTLKKRMGR